MMISDSMEHPPQSPDEVLAGLMEINARLASTSLDYGARIHLIERRHKLRSVAAELERARRSRAEVVRELKHLCRLRDDIFSRHVSVGHIGSGKEGGAMEARYVFAMNEAIDAAWNRRDLEERIGQLEGELGRLGRTAKTTV